MASPQLKSNETRLERRRPTWTGLGVAEPVAMVALPLRVRSFWVTIRPRLCGFRLREYDQSRDRRRRSKGCTARLSRQRDHEPKIPAREKTYEAADARS